MAGTSGWREPKGLKESAKAWDRARQSVPKELQKMYEEQAEAGAERARQRLESRAGGNRAKRRPSDIFAEGGNIFIAGGFTTVGAEFGRAVHQVFGRTVDAASMHERVFPPPDRGGYLVGPEMLAAPVKRRVRELADEGLKTISKELDRAGVPRA